MDSGSIICLNGKYLAAGEAAVSACDGAVLYGMGLFETIKLTGGKPARTDLHLSRLMNSARALGLKVPFSAEKINEMLYGTAEKNNIKAGALRLTLTAGGDAAAPSVIINVRQQVYSKEKYARGIRAGFTKFRRNETSPLVRHKNLNYYENIIAKRQAASCGWDEALFLNQQGFIAEGSVSNIFIVGGGNVITPDVNSGLLPGITRRRIIDICFSMGISLEERPVRPEELFSSDECFVTNSLMGVMPLAAVDDRAIGSGLPGEITTALFRELENQ
ncbi:MAG: aminotransferase class IV [Bacillota bacterium]